MSTVIGQPTEQNRQIEGWLVISLMR